MKKYHMGEFGVAVSIELCKLNEKAIIVRGWHIKNEEEAINNLVEKLKSIKQHAEDAINQITNDKRRL